MTSTMDRIEKKVSLHAPLARVWRAISDAKEFGLWFGMELDAPFVAGTTVTGRIAPTTVDAEVATGEEEREQPRTTGAHERPGPIISRIGPTLLNGD